MATSLSRRTPFIELGELRGWLDRAFEDIIEGGNGGKGKAWMPAIDVVRDKDALTITADVPGVKPDQIKVTVEDDVLTVSGGYEESKEEKEKNFVRRERRQGTFSRSISLPPNADPDAIEAVCKDGVLEVKIPIPSETTRGPIEIQPKGA